MTIPYTNCVTAEKELNYIHVENVLEGLKVTIRDRSIVKIVTSKAGLTGFKKNIFI